VELGPHLAYRKSECWKLSAYSCARRRSIPTPKFKGAEPSNKKCGFDHGAGHPLLLLCNAKASNYSKNKAFNDLAHYSEWPKVAGAVIKAKNAGAQTQSQLLSTETEERATMAETTVKHKVLKAIEELPHDATFEDVLERLYFLYKIDKGLQQVAAGEIISHEEAMKRIKTWHA